MFLQIHSSTVIVLESVQILLKDLASLQICNEKNFLVLGFEIFVSDVISRVVLAFLAHFI